MRHTPQVGSQSDRDVTNGDLKSNEYPLEAPLTRGDHWGRLMRAALVGDEVSYERLLLELAQSLRASVRSVLARSGQGNADVEDVVQETLLAVHLKRGTWNRSLPFAPWINAIARYKTVDALRRRGRRSSVPIHDLEDVLASPAELEHAPADVEKLMKDLTDRQRLIVRAVAIEGHRTAEVALTLGLSDGNVRVILHRALQKMARHLRSSRS
jgi:RNA polymerase sigma factor (sigma-70 family)